MLELDKLIFATDTSQLDTAVKKLGDLQTAVVNLNKPIKQTTVETEKLAQAQAKTSKANSDAATAAAKAELAQGKLVKQTEKQISVTKNNLTVLEKQQQILEFMTQGFSKGQATVLTYAKAAGAVASELKTLGEVQQTMRKLQGGDPFDKSISGLVSLKNSLMEAREANRLYTAGIDLTSAQTKELARDKQRLIEAMKINGASFDMIKQKLREHNAEYIKVSEAVNRLDRAEKAKMQTDRETGKATDYLSREMQRAENALAGLNNEVAISSSNRLLRFREGLIAAGVATDVAAKRYEAYAKVIAETDAKRKAQQKSDEQSRIDNLSRGLAPQISDVAVSLYGGMSPMTVLMQQGLQVRDLIQSSGVEADKLNEVLKKTGADFLGTLTGTFKAVGSLVVGVFQSAGASTAKFIGDITGLSGAFEYLRYQVALMEKDTDKVTSVLGKFGSVVLNSAIPMIATGLAGLAIAAVTASVALKQLIVEESNFSKVLNLNGAALGINRDAAYTLATTYAGARGDINGYVAAMTEAAKAGNISATSLKTVTDSAVYMKSVAGVAIEDTVKQFSELAKDPVKAIEKVAISLGTIDPEIVKVVRSLKEQGKEAEAAAIATAAYAEGLAKAGATIKTDMGFLESFFKTIGSAASSMWDKILNVGREGTLQQQIDAAKEKIKSISSGEGLFILSDRDVVLGIEKARLEGLEKELAVQKKLNDQKQRNVELVKSDSDVEALLDKYKLKSDKKAEAIAKVNTLFDKNIALAKEAGKATDVIEANRKLVLAGVNEDFKEKSTKKEDTAGIAAMWEKVSSAVNKANQSYDEVVNGVQVYTNSQKIMIDLLDDPAFLKQPEILQKEALARLAVAHATEQQTQEVKDLWEAEKRVILETFKSEAEVDALRIAREQRGDSEIINAQNKLELLNEELADMMLQKAIYGELTVEQKKQIEYAKVQKEYKAEELRIAKLLADPKNGIDEKSAEYLRNQNYEAAAKKRRNIDQAIILENLKFEQIQRKEIAMAFGEAIATSLFEGGKAGTKKLKSFIESELRNRITLQIQANVETSMKGNTGANQLVQAGANFGSTLSTKGLGSAVEGGFMDAGAFLFNNGFKDFGNSLLDLGNSLGEFSSVVDSTVGYLGAFNTASEGDYGAAIGEALGTYFGGPIGAAIGKEIGSWLGLTEGGGTAHMGGYGAYSASGGSVKGSTLRGAVGAQFGLADDSIKAASNTMLAGVAQGIVSILDDTANAFGKQAGYYAATSFADDTSDDGAWGALAIKLGDKVLTDWADTQTSRWAPKEFADGEAGLKQYQDALAKSTLDTLNSMGLPEWAAAMLAEIGDTPTMESLTKTISEISAVKDVLTGIGEVIADVFGNATTSSEDAVIALSKVSGGLDKLANNLSGYYSNFYTEEEQLANLRNATSEEFTKLGETLPSTREEFRSMVAIAQMLGDSTKVASLLKFQDAINELVPTFEEVSNALKEARDNQVKLEKEVFDERYGLETRLATVQQNTTALRQRELDKIHPLNQELQKYVWMLEDAAEATKKVNELTKSISESYTKDLEKTITELEKAFEVTDNAMSQLEAAVEAEKKAIDTQVNSLEKTKDTLKNVFETLDEAIKSLYDSVKSTTAKNYNEARAILTRAAGGEKIASATLLPAVSTAVAGVNSRVYSSRFEQDKASILLANELSIIKDNTESQMTDVEKQLNALETQSKLLDSQLETAKTSLDALRGIDGTLISVQAALDKLGSSSLSEKVAREQINAAKQQIAMIEKFSSSQEESLKANLDELIKVAFNTDSIVDVLSKLPDSIADLMKESIRTIANDFAKQSGSRMTDSQLQSVIDSVVSGKQTVGSATSEILRSSVTDSNIADFIKSINLEAADSAQIIAAKAKEFGVSLEDIARSTGYSLDMVGSYLRNGGVSSVDMQALSRNSSNLTATGGVISTATATKVLRNLLNQGDFLGAYNLAKQEGFTLAGVDYLGGYPSGTSASWAAMNGLPAFATGTNYVPSDMIAQIHEGEMIVPKKFNPEAIGNTASDEKELEMLRYELRAVAQHTAKLSKAIDRLTVGTNEGDALQVRVAV